MITLGRTLDLKVAAEGVETEGVFDYICSHGVHQAPGFYIGKPMSGACFASWYWEYGERHRKRIGCK